MVIKFGTDGWRGEIARDFTFGNVKRVAQAAASYLSKHNLAEKGLVIGYDNRFLSERYAQEIVKIVSEGGIKVYFSPKSAPTPAISFAVKDKQAAGAVMVTASHNPPEWNGLKFKTANSASAPPEVTKEIEAEISKSQKLRVKDQNKGQVILFDPKPAYFKWLKNLLDLKIIAQAGLKIIFDPMHGSSAGYLTDLLQEAGVEVIEINSERDPLFGGVLPEPLPPNIQELISFMGDFKDKNKLWAGIVLDGDGDRIAGVDENVHFINSHQVFALLLKHLVECRKMSGEVVKTFNISQLINKMAQKYNLKLHETKIGFKYIAELMEKRNILIGGEESGGLGIKGHIPERDGTLNALLLLETMALQKKGLGQILADIYHEFGRYYYDRVDLHNVKADLQKFRVKELAGQKVIRIEDLDGIKLFFENGDWILFRPSGTEPLLRIYAEAESQVKVEQMLLAGKNIVSNLSKFAEIRRKTSACSSRL